MFNSVPFWVVFGGMMIHCVIDILTDFLFQLRLARKCSFDCSTCRNWKCHYKYCQKKKAEYERKNEYEN